MRARLICCALLLACFLMQPALAENWPQWRGPQGTGVSSEAGLPLQWSPTENIRWKVKLPEAGNSTPIVWGNRIFVTQPLKNDHQRTLLCLDRKDGKTLWQANAPYAAEEPTHATNPFCSASPVTDGERVIAWFGSAGVFCYDFEGKQLWTRDLGIQEHEWGYAASPIIQGDLVFINFGPGKNEFVIALDKRTGEQVWRYDLPRPSAEQLKQDDNLRGSWSTPLVINAGGREELILTLPERVVAFAPKTGNELWSAGGLGSLVYTSPMWGDGVLVALGGYHRASVAVRPGGSGDVTSTHVLWQQPKSKLRLGSGVIHKGHIYVNDMQGIASCLDLGTGKTAWEERLTAGGTGDTWSSMILTADERIYMLNQAGETFVINASPKFELLAANPLDEATNSSTVISDGEIFIRTHEHLWCIGKPQEDRAAR